MVLQKVFKPSASSRSRHRPRALDHLAEAQVGRGIEIEHQPARQFGLIGLAIPGMQLGGADLRRRRQPFDPVDLQVRLLVAFDLHLFHEVGTARHGVALEERLAGDTVGRAHQGARPAFDVIDHPVADRLVVLRQLELGDRRLSRPATKACRDARSPRP